MPKPITTEMLYAMTPAQRDTLQKNALGRDTPAAHAVLELLSQGDLMRRSKPTSPVARKAAGPRRSANVSSGKPVKAIHGRQA